MSLADALKDLKDAVLGGEEPNEDLFASIADDYGLNPKLIARKWVENGWTVEGIRQMAAATDPLRSLEKKIDNQIDSLCQYYQVPREQAVNRLWNGQKVTLICHLPQASRWGYVAVKHSDASIVKLPWSARFEACN